MHVFVWILLLAVIGLLFSYTEHLTNPGPTGTTGTTGPSGPSGPSGTTGVSAASSLSSSVATFGPTGATGASTMSALMNGSGPTGPMAPLSPLPSSTPMAPQLGPTGPPPSPSSMFSGDQLMISSEVKGMGMAVPVGPTPTSLPGGAIDQTNTAPSDPRASANPIPYIANPPPRGDSKATSTLAPFS